MATSLEDIHPYVEMVNISFESDDSVQIPKTTIDRTDGQLLVRVAYPTDYAPSSSAERERFKEWLIEAVAQVMEVSMLPKNGSTHIEKLARDERVFSRVLVFAETAIGVENILGSNAKVRFQDLGYRWGWSF